MVGVDVAVPVALGWGTAVSVGGMMDGVIVGTHVSVGVKDGTRVHVEIGAGVRLGGAKIKRVSPVQ
jgi:hypothetical protein